MAATELRIAKMADGPLASIPITPEPQLARSEGHASDARALS
ncbi:hypothetical protein SM0020_22452 [Sinorhizobium meliloti CCNWSX0020]|uniref:Uncharacterized protein n=1 Tax=Sinorhizobium meliloti CCNWSX0020 TaxID=1107881 RepID=H0G4T4_RHIML|nr:hypothetical protein SM0020_22452 [Sinorhizobium meliloti CCNWSX0020]PII38441.1 hypothetical protein T190_20625 [Sinorhizobium meliloti CCBAU 01290]